MSTAAMQELKPSDKITGGEFVWFELRTTDAPAAIDFYTRVVGWEAKASGDPDGMPYTLLSINGQDAAGLMQLSPDMLSGGMKPGWLGFIGVPDVDGYARRLEAAGGKLHFPPQDIPGIGRFASVEDPQGAPFLLFKGTHDGAPPRPAMGAPGSVGWSELYANEGPAAWSFYSVLFGWQEDRLMDMGRRGVYRIFKHGGPQLGGIMTRDPGKSMSPHWLFYFCVDDIDQATARITEKGGQVSMGPHQVPGGSWIVIGADPQGTAFAIAGPRNS